MGVKGPYKSIIIKIKIELTKASKVVNNGHILSHINCSFVLAMNSLGFEMLNCSSEHDVSPFMLPLAL